MASRTTEYSNIHLGLPNNAEDINSKDEFLHDIAYECHRHQPTCNNEGGIPNGGLGITGKEAILIRSISDSCSRFVLARRFWNQIFT